MNLVLNARDAMVDGGTLRFKATNHFQGQQINPLVPEMRAGPYVYLQVIETAQVFLLSY